MKLGTIKKGGGVIKMKCNLGTPIIIFIRYSVALFTFAMEMAAILELITGTQTLNVAILNILSTSGNLQLLRYSVALFTFAMVMAAILEVFRANELQIS